MKAVTVTSYPVHSAVEIDPATTERRLREALVGAGFEQVGKKGDNSVTLRSPDGEYEIVLNIEHIHVLHDR